RPFTPSAECKEPYWYLRFACFAAQRIHFVRTAGAALGDNAINVGVRDIRRGVTQQTGVLGDYLEATAAGQLDRADHVLDRVGVRVVKLDILEALLAAPLELLMQIFGPARPERVDLAFIVLRRCVRRLQVGPVAPRICLIKKIAVPDTDAAFDWLGVVGQDSPGVIASWLCGRRPDHISQRLAGGPAVGGLWPSVSPGRPEHDGPDPPLDEWRKGRTEAILRGI